MSKSLILGLSVCWIVGCTSTRVTAPGWTLQRTSFLQKVSLVDIEVNTNGTAKLKGYRNDGGAEVTAAIVAAAVEAAIKGAK